MNTTRLRRLIAAALMCALVVTTTHAADAPKMKMTTDIPASITTPDTVETRLGTLKFIDGFPDHATVQKVYDNLDFQRGVQVFLTAMPGASLVGHARCDAQVSGAGQRLSPSPRRCWIPSRSSSPPTPNTSIRRRWIDLKDGPMVMESPPNVLGIWTTSGSAMSPTSATPDRTRARAASFSFCRPATRARSPRATSCPVHRPSETCLFRAAFWSTATPKPRGGEYQETLRIYPLAQAQAPPRRSSSMSRAAAQHHPRQQFLVLRRGQPGRAGGAQRARWTRRRSGLLAAIGIEKGKPFAPDARMKKILTEAAAVGNATARASPSSPESRKLTSTRTARGTPRSSAAATSSEQPGVRLLDARTDVLLLRHGRSPRRCRRKWSGPARSMRWRSRMQAGQPFDGGKTYKLNLPPNIPVKDFWSLVVYDNQTRSMLQTDQQFPSMGSQKKGIVINAGQIRGCLVRTESAGRKRRQLGPDRSRQRLEYDPPPLRPARTLLRQDLAAERDRTGEMSRPNERAPFGPKFHVGLSCEGSLHSWSNSAPQVQDHTQLYRLSAYPLFAAPCHSLHALQQIHQGRIKGLDPNQPQARELQVENDIHRSPS